jgi:hypothetical protein
MHSHIGVCRCYPFPALELTVRFVFLVVRLHACRLSAQA